MLAIYVTPFPPCLIVNPQQREGFNIALVKVVYCSAGIIQVFLQPTKKPLCSNATINMLGLSAI
jgi:hypothetical protein